MALMYKNGKIVDRSIPMMSNEQLLRIMNEPVRRNKVYEEMEAKGLLPDPDDVKEMSEETIQKILDAHTKNKQI